MKKVLYITNIEVPYRVKFFNELAKHCDLTVLYEMKNASSRNANWSSSVNILYKSKYLNGLVIKNENSFCFSILKELFKNYDVIIVGCYNSPVQLFAMLIMNLFNIKYYINADGETFLNDNSFKSKIKKFLISHAYGYLVAGEKSALSLEKAIKKKTYPYYFSSLTQDEVIKNNSINKKRNNTVLIVGQFVPEKGLNIAVEVAKMDPNIKYKFIGTGNRTNEFITKYNVNSIQNIEVIPFLQKEELKIEFQNCSLFVLPSIKECWGLVINEAASFGTPIVSTKGSGAAVEFLLDQYPQYLAEPNDAPSLFQCIYKALNDDLTIYKSYLINKSKNYTIEKSVEEHIKICNL